MAKILVVDDVDLERMNMVDIVRKAGHTVIEATNGEEALEVARKQKPDAVFMDIVMPKMDGFGACKRMMMDPELKKVPVVIVSSKNQESDKFRAEQLGAKGYVTKPAKVEQIVPILNKIL